MCYLEIATHYGDKMNLYEMTNALEEIGFKEVPTSKIVTNDLDYNKRTEWSRYSIGSGDLKGTSVFSMGAGESSRPVSIVLPDIIQDMYLDAVKQLEEVTEVPYDFCDRADTCPKSNYTSSCSSVYEILYLAFGDLLEKVEIIPEEISGTFISRPFELDFFMLDHPSEEKIFGDNYRLSLMPKYADITEKDMDILSRLPEKMQRLDNLREDWNKFVSGICDYGETNKQFYQTMGDSYFKCAHKLKPTDVA